MYICVIQVTLLYSRDWHSYISVFKRNKEENKPDFLVLAISLTKLVIWFCFKLAQ